MDIDIFLVQACACNGLNLVSCKTNPNPNIKINIKIKTNSKTAPFPKRFPLKTKDLGRFQPHLFVFCSTEQTTNNAP